MSKRELIFGFEPIIVGEGVLPDGRELMAIGRQDVRSVRRYVYSGEEPLAVEFKDGVLLASEKMRLAT